MYNIRKNIPHKTLLNDTVKNKLYDYLFEFTKNIQNHTAEHILYVNSDKYMKYIKLIVNNFENLNSFNISYNHFIRTIYNISNKINWGEAGPYDFIDDLILVNINSGITPKFIGYNAIIKSNNYINNLK